jgi:hypothetical protein
MSCRGKVATGMAVALIGAAAAAAGAREEKAFSARLDLVERAAAAAAGSK